MKISEKITKVLGKIQSKEDLKMLKFNPDLITKNKIDKNNNLEKIALDQKIDYQELRCSMSAYLAKNNTRLLDMPNDSIRDISIEHGPIEKCQNVIFSRGKTVILGAINLCNERFNIGETIRDEKNIILIFSQIYNWKMRYNIFFRWQEIFYVYCEQCKQTV